MATTQQLHRHFGLRPFAVADAVAAGVSANRISRAWSAGLLMRVAKGWYAVIAHDDMSQRGGALTLRSATATPPSYSAGSAPTDWDSGSVVSSHPTVASRQRVDDPRGLPQGSVLCGDDASEFWSQPIPPRPEAAESSAHRGAKGGASGNVPTRPERHQVEVILPRGASGRRGHRPGVFARRWRLPESHVVRTANGLLVTDVLRTAIDVARGLPLPFALVSLDAALQSVVTDGDLPLPVARQLLGERVVDLAGGKGIAAVRQALPWAHPAAESPLESIVRGRIIEAGLPTPRLQVPIVGASGRHYRGDLGLDLPGDPPGSCRLIIEADGLGKYGNPADVREEKKRHLDIERTGREIVRVLYSEGVYRPTEFLGWIRHLLAG